MDEFKELEYKLIGDNEMKKIPTLFERVFENHKKVGILPKVTPGMEWVLEGRGTATVKYDGSCCAIINGELYKRYDAKHGKKAPEGIRKYLEEHNIEGLVFWKDGYPACKIKRSDFGFAWPKAPGQP